MDKLNIGINYASIFFHMISVDPFLCSTDLNRVAKGKSGVCVDPDKPLPKGSKIFHSH